jgi:hypothetical protein
LEEVTTVTRSLRFTALMLGALDMAMAFSHLLELPAKMRYDSRLWVTLQNSLYRPFGTVGAVIENGAVLSSLGLSLVVRRSPAAFPLTLVGAACQALALGIWLAFVRPVNNRVRGWTAMESAPPEWTQLRRQWEYSHAARAVLTVAGFGALVISVLMETPLTARRTFPGNPGFFSKERLCHGAGRMARLRNR